MSEFVEVKTAELSGAALDWAVAQVEGVEYLHAGIKCRTRLTARTFHHYTKPNFMPSTDWSQGGPLMDKHCKGFGMLQDGTDSRWRSFAYSQDTGMQRMVGGETILIAFCRALVALSLGDTISVPKELL